MSDRILKTLLKEVSTRYGILTLINRLAILLKVRRYILNVIILNNTKYPISGRHVKKQLPVVTLQDIIALFSPQLSS